MLLERRARPIRGIRVVSRDTAPFGVQVVPTRRLTADEVRRLLDRLPPVDGPIVTSALSTSEQEPFLACGFSDRERLHLLRHDFRNPPAIRSDATLRSGRRADLDAVLDIDARSFDPFWSFDRTALGAARKATPHNRYVVACVDKRVVGYAITGVAGTSSFLQRLAVHPGSRGHRIGSHLVSDAIAWAQRRGCFHMMVNTQTSNDGAFTLYKQLGFSVDADQLRVLEWTAQPDRPGRGHDDRG